MFLQRVIWLPFHRVLERLAILTVRDGKDEERTAGGIAGTVCTG